MSQTRKLSQNGVCEVFCRVQLLLPRVCVCLSLSLSLSYVRKIYYYIPQVLLPNLRKLVLADLACGKIWDDKFRKGFHNLRELKVARCDSLESVMWSSTSNSFEHLETLSTRDCKKMKEVIKGVEAEQGSRSMVVNKILLPKLRSIELDELPQLERFCSGDRIECPSLVHLWINNCKKIATFITEYSSPNRRQCCWS